MKTFIFAFVLLLPTFSLAGNGSSGGGNIYGDQLNPWFLENTREVTYCVEMSDDFSDITVERAVVLINESFTYWKQTFNEYIGYEFEDPGYRLATQTFNYDPECTEETDIRFQLGVLSADQLKVHANYKSILGLAQRTDYDEVQLKGKGYIYIAPERGPLRPASPHMLKEPWQFENNRALRLALIHEIGHVFGLQDDHYSERSLMSATFVDGVASQRYMAFMSPSSPFGCNINHDGSFSFGFNFGQIGPVGTPGPTPVPKNELREFLGLPAVHFDLNYEANGGKAHIWIDKKDWATIDIGRLTISPGDHLDSAIQLYLTPKQKVFKKVPYGYYTYTSLYHVKKSHLVKDVTLQLKSGKSLNLFMNFDQNCMPTIGSTYNGKTYFDIFLGF